jgi:branched-chain amino acid transport system permease protein
MAGEIAKSNGAADRRALAPICIFVPRREILSYSLIPDSLSAPFEPRQKSRDNRGRPQRVGELANRNSWLTGGADGLDFAIGRVLGQFPIDFAGRRAAALYSFAVVFALFALARRVTRSSFGQSVQAIRQNRLRAGALGIPASRRLVAMYGLAAAYAGAAGALLAQTTQIVSLDIFDFHRSADVLLTLIVGGPGYLYGGLIGAAIFIGLRDALAGATPEYWEFWLGLLLVALVTVGRERVETTLKRLARRLRPAPPREATP